MTALGVVKTDSLFRKVERGESVECKVHGFHDNWRLLYKTKNIKCRLCGAEYQKADRNKHPIKYLLKDAKQHAKQRNQEYDLSEQDIINLLEKQNNRCAINGLSFSEYKLSLDRIDSNKGYTVDNVQLVTIKVNRMKSDFEVSEFIELCKQIAQFNRSDSNG